MRRAVITIPDPQHQSLGWRCAFPGCPVTVSDASMAQYIKENTPHAEK